MDTSCRLTRTSAGGLTRRHVNMLLGRFGLAAIVLLRWVRRAFVGAFVALGTGLALSER